MRRPSRGIGRKFVGIGLLFCVDLSLQSGSLGGHRFPKLILLAEEEGALGLFYGLEEHVVRLPRYLLIAGPDKAEGRLIEHVFGTVVHKCGFGFFKSLHVLFVAVLFFLAGFFFFPVLHLSDSFALCLFRAAISAGLADALRLILFFAQDERASSVS